MNCFRFVSLKYWTQQIKTRPTGIYCCELLSICIFEILNTTGIFTYAFWIRLWIAFDLYLWNIEHNKWLIPSWQLNVVNCFRFVSLKYWTQLIYLNTLTKRCCELLSICIFEILNTTCWCIIDCHNRLWIAFDLYLWNIEHNYCLPWVMIHLSCELLSICIFEILNTTLITLDQNTDKLWIAFDLYLWNIEHNRGGYNSLLYNLLWCISEWKNEEKVVCL